ncbi:cytochrome P450 4C1-like [Ooceraea biroi]|uniref:cytochrome P450 4C1-like n=1 Tax=Ooceraea biroi TaxID=2015173 RepID=UPI000F094A3C|nr:cytochrome P450 4C1-like [Ooceraea biroi]
MIVGVLLSCAIFAFFYYYVIHLARFRRLINLIPGPRMVPIFGDIFTLLSHGTPERLWDLIKFRFERYSPIYKTWYFTIAYVAITYPDEMQTILNNSKSSTKGMAYKLLRPWMGDGLLLSKGTKWQERRKILTPAFHFHILKNFFSILVEESNRMTISLKHMKDSTVEDLTSFTSHHTLNIICETSMGISLRNIETSEQQQYRKAIHDISEIIIYRFLRPWYQYDTIFWFTPKYKQQVKCLKILHGFTEKIITERKRYHETTGGRYLNFENTAEFDDMTGSRKKRLAMLDLMIAASNNNQMSDSDIREEVDTFMFEGHDTVSMAMTFAILLLAEHKDVQDRVRTEVNAVMEKNGGKLTMTALQNLSYLERCLKETMRLYPSVLLITRTLVEDVMLKSYLVPAGVELYIDILSLHKNPEFWPNPEVFDPDRFLPELVQNRHPFAYIPFSAGSRNCIGQRFAMMELKTVIGTLVHNFCLEPIDYLKDCRCVVDLIIRIGQPMQRLWDLIKFRFERYSPIYKTWYFTIAYVAITYPDEMQTILNNSKSSTKGMAYKLLRPWMGDGLLLSKGRKKRLAMLDLMIAASNNNQMSDSDIREEVDTFMFEGHDTVSMAMTFAILLLAEYKDVQDRVRNEVNAVMKENGGKLTMTALQNLSYLERCLKETMRLYPSVFFITRTLVEDVMLQSYLVPAGVELYIDILSLHKNPEFWPNPEVFDPDRFLPELVQNRHPFAYIPFSAGSRNCIGQRFAMMELKTVIGTLVHNFCLEPIDYLKDCRCVVDLIIRIGQPMRVKFVPV